MLYAMSKFFTILVRRYLPDAYLFVILLTFITFFSALIFTDTSVFKIIDAWGDGISTLFVFTIQMALIYITGYAFASTESVHRIINHIAGLATTTYRASVITFLVTALGSLFNWGFGLVVGGIVAREIARRVPNIDYAFIVAAGYSGFVVWHGGLSSSIGADLATEGGIFAMALESEGISPFLLSFNETILSSFNITITLCLLIAMPLLFYRIQPKAHEIKTVNPKLFSKEQELKVPEREDTPASRLEHSKIITLLFSLFGFSYIVYYFYTYGFSMNLNILIIVFMWLGIFFHKKPINYVYSLKDASAGASGILTQFPLYGGIQGIMIASGLVDNIANYFVEIATAQTFPLFTFLAAGFTNCLVPSGGGQWIVQAPIVIPVAVDIGANPALVGMAVAYGDQWTNMIQPFWALPMLAIAKLDVRDIMGPCIMTLLVSGFIMGSCLYLFA